MSLQTTTIQGTRYKRAPAGPDNYRDANAIQRISKITIIPAYAGMTTFWELEDFKLSKKTDNFA